MTPRSHESLAEHIASTPVVYDIIIIIIISSSSSSSKHSVMPQ